MTLTRLGLALVVVMTAAGVVHADLAAGRDKLIAGDYKAAIAELGKVTGKDRPAARLLLARAQRATGDYAGAEATLVPLTQGKDALAIDAHLAFDELRRITGRTKDARADLASGRDKLIAGDYKAAIGERARSRARSARPPGSSWPARSLRPATTPAPRRRWSR